MTQEARSLRSRGLNVLSPIKRTRLLGVPPFRPSISPRIHTPCSPRAMPIGQHPPSDEKEGRITPGETRDYRSSCGRASSKRIPHTLPSNPRPFRHPRHSEDTATAETGRERESEREREKERERERERGTNERGPHRAGNQTGRQSGLGLARLFVDDEDEDDVVDENDTPHPRWLGTYSPPASSSEKQPRGDNPSTPADRATARRRRIDRRWRHGVHASVGVVVADNIISPPRGSSGWIRRIIHAIVRQEPLITRIFTRERKARCVVHGIVPCWMPAFCVRKASGDVKGRRASFHSIYRISLDSKNFRWQFFDANRKRFSVLHPREY